MNGTELLPVEHAPVGPLTDPVEAAVAGIRSDLTRKIYTHDVKEFLARLAERWGLDATQATHDDLLRWWDWIRSTPLKPATVNRKVSAVKRFYREGFRRKLFTEDAAEGLPSLVVSKEPQGRALDLLEVRALIDACPAGGTLSDLRDRLIVSFLILTGCRVTELSRVTLADLGFERGHRMVHFRRKRGKEDRQKITPDLAVLIDAWVARAGFDDGALVRAVVATGEGDRVREGALGRTSIYRAVIVRAIRAGLGPGVGPHDLRRTWITTAAELEPRTMRVSRAAAHESPATTMRYDFQRSLLDDHPSDRVAAWVRGDAPAA